MKTKDLLALTRLNMLGDWVKLKTKVNHRKLLEEIEPFNDQWKQYNPRKPINRFGLSITSFDGQLSGIPDLDSISEYNKQHNTKLDNFSCTELTDVYKQSDELQTILAPFKDHLLRAHFIKLNAGGYFPDHRDCYPEFENDKREQIRLIFFVNKCHQSTLKFIYEDKLLSQVNNGAVYYFNGNKPHCVFSTANDCIFIIVNLKFDSDLYHIITTSLDIN